jgi:hypothetical protein
VRRSCLRTRIALRATPLRECLFAFAALVCLNVAASNAADRERVLGWIAPSGEPGGFQVFLGERSHDYTEVIDLGFVPPDADGVTRTTLNLDSALGYFVAMTAYNDVGESDYSNELFVPASACEPLACDDDDPCTADDCGEAGCVHAVLPDGTACDADGGVCASGLCAWVDCFDDAECSNGNLCDGSERCIDYVCTSSKAPLCPEPTQCQTGGCSTESGCWIAALPDGTGCDDGLGKTRNDRCEAGVCVGTERQRRRGRHRVR